MSTATEKLERYREKLAVNIIESERQAQFAGERLGIFARLRELEKQRRYYERKIAELEATA